MNERCDPVLRLFPGSVRVSTLAEDELAALPQQRVTHPAPARAVSEAAELDAFCEWLSCYGLDVIGTVTFSDDYAQRWGITSLARAVEDVKGALRSIHLRRGDARGFVSGFPFSYALAGEWHRTGRQVPHVHLALESRGANQDRLLRELRSFFDGSRGRSRFEVMRDRSAATLYGLKDTVKSVKLDSDALYVRLSSPRKSSRNQRGPEHGPMGGPPKSAAYYASGLKERGEPEGRKDGPAWCLE